MGKYIFQYALPAIFLLAITYKVCYYWYTQKFKTVIEHTKLLKRKSAEYDSQYLDE